MPRQDAGIRFQDRIGRRESGQYLFRCQRRGHPEESFEGSSRRIVETYRADHDQRHHSRSILGLMEQFPAPPSDVDRPDLRDEIRAIVREEVHRALVQSLVFGAKDDSTHLLEISIVADRYRLSAAYFARCIKARESEAYRIRQKIPKATMAALPLRGWFKRGNRWFIRVSDLRPQL